MLDSNTWGPHYWFFLHTIAISYPKHPNAITKKKIYDLSDNQSLKVNGVSVVVSDIVLKDSIQLGPVELSFDFFHTTPDSPTKIDSHIEQKIENDVFHKDAKFSIDVNNSTEININREDRPTHLPKMLPEEKNIEYVKVPYLIYCYFFYFHFNLRAQK
jgi:hypothetical protein